jgi:hypothetical protein
MTEQQAEKRKDIQVEVQSAMGIIHMDIELNEDPRARIDEKVIQVLSMDVDREEQRDSKHVLTIMLRGKTPIIPAVPVVTTVPGFLQPKGKEKPTLLAPCNTRSVTPGLPSQSSIHT